jgi:hypothetical protein
VINKKQAKYIEDLVTVAQILSANKIPIVNNSRKLAITPTKNGRGRGIAYKTVL